MSSRLVGLRPPSLPKSPTRSPEVAKPRAPLGLLQPDGEQMERPPSSPNNCCLCNSASKFMSLALKAAFNLLLGSCKVGGVILRWFGQGEAPPIGEEAPVGVKGGVDVEGINIDGEPSPRGLIGATSKALALDEYDLGEGTPEPVEAYKGRSSSSLCAKKHTLRVQLVSSLQSRVLYWAGCSQHSNIP
uniref:Uncharacterized protein n=1 Tax=Opuntia streptacantha TaxID=393608 RepID=A0A7C9DAS8_OPUST